MDDENDAATGDTAAEQAAFGAGFGTEDKPAKSAPEGRASAKDQPEPAAATPQVEAKPEPKYVQVTEADWADVRAAAAKTANLDSQLSKAWGTIGGLQRWINEQKAAGQPTAVPAAVAKKFQVPKEAFAAMERDFPELAQQTRAALEAALSGLPGPGASDAQDPAKLEALLAQYTAKRELVVLEDAFPTWREIVGAVDTSTGQPPPDNAFRKWLGTKDEAYQQRINASESAQVIGRSIRLFQKETAVQTNATAQPRNDVRTERIRAAIQPKGDSQGAAPRNTSEEAFAEGFGSR
jgi:hypothetical protein